MNLSSNLVGNLCSSFPHGIVGDCNLIFLIGISPGCIFLNDLLRILAPDRTMRRSNDVKCQIESRDFRQFLCQDRCKWIQNVGEVLHCLPVQQTLICLVIEQLLYGIVLSEGIVGEQNIISGHKGRHGIRPVKHAHFHKNQLLPVSDLHTVTGFYDMEVPAAFAVLPLDALDSIGSAIDGCFRNFFHQRCQGSGVIAFSVIGDDEIDLMKVDLFFQVLNKIKTVRRPNGIDQNSFLFFNQIGVLTGAIHNGIIITMKTFQFPVNISDPTDVSFYQLSHVFFSFFLFQCKQ